MLYYYHAQLNEKVGSGNVVSVVFVVYLLCIQSLLNREAFNAQLKKVS